MFNFESLLGIDPVLVQGSRFLQFRFFTLYTNFGVNIGISDVEILEKKIIDSKDMHPIFTVSQLSPI